MITIVIEGYLDGVAVKRELAEPSKSRWEIQEAEKVTVVFGRRNSSSSTSTSTSPLAVDLVQLPRSLSSSKIGVGAVLWDGGIVLAALLASVEASLFGETVVELGAGVGLPSLVCALLGARVVATDREAAVSGVLGRNASPFLSDGCKLPPDPGKVALEVLEFGTADGDAAADALADSVRSSSSGGGFDLVLAADCCYVDGADEARTPSARGLCRAAARLLLRREPCGSFSCRPTSRALVASELRDSGTQALFVEAAEEHFSCVRRLHLPPEASGSGSGGGGGGGEGETGWSHIIVYELSGPRAEAAVVGASSVPLSASEARALRKPRKRGWP